MSRSSEAKGRLGGSWGHLMESLSELWGGVQEQCYASRVQSGGVLPRHVAAASEGSGGQRQIQGLSVPLEGCGKVAS